MTPDEIRARYVIAIGETATAKLEKAGLLPVSMDTRQATVEDTRSGPDRTVVFRDQRRLCTGWETDQ